MLLPLNLGQRLPRFRRTGGILLLAGLVGIAGVASSADFGTASAEQAAYVGVAVPAGLVDVIAQASLSCPSLTAPRVAGQIMAESGFQNGAGGLAGLTGQQWEQWKPWPDAAQTDAAANVTALAHRMCDLAGQVRNTQIDGDAWMLALAAYDIGMPTVVGAKAVPSAAEGYVTAVTGYTAWYVAQADTVVMPSASVPAPVVAPGGSAPGKIPDAYVDLIVKAGGTCPQIGAAELAGQLMAASAFNPDLLGADGSQGIAQFLPSVWQRYAKAGESPWEPADAIGVLARTMCALTSNLRGITADPYPSALAAYHWGATTLERPGDMPDSAAVKAYADRVIAYAAYYAQDARLDDGERTGTKTATTASAPGKSAVPKPSGAVTKSKNPAQPAKSKTPGAAKTTTAAPAVLSGVQVVGYVDKCLYAAANTAGQQLAIRTCDSKVASQRWQIYTDGTIRQDKLCMDLANGSSANGTRIQLAACNGNAAQQFLINSSYDMVNTVYGKCADVIDGNTANGAKVQLWDCNGAGHQKWMIRG